MRSIRAFAVAVTAVSLLSASAQAATYYVATNGSDGANGSLATPFRTQTIVSSASRRFSPKRSAVGAMSCIFLVILGC